jgi:simple sugar transport system permease protein
VLSQIPVLGEIFFNHTVLVYLGFLLVPISWFVMYKTSFGLNVRAVGENPRAVDAAGISVYGLRYVCTILAGLMAGLGGAAILLEETFRYFEGMIAGRGFLALAMVMFGTWTPHKVWGAAVIIGVAMSVQLNLQVLGIWKGPIDFISMMPYALTIVVLALTVRRGGMPAALTVPYKREE